MAESSYQTSTANTAFFTHLPSNDRSEKRLQWQ